MVRRRRGGGESRDIWKLGPLCLKRLSPRVSSAEVRLRCRDSRELSVCNRMWYAPWLHWTVARWVVGEPATHEACNRLLARFSELRDLHPGNVGVGRSGAVVVHIDHHAVLGLDLLGVVQHAEDTKSEAADCLNPSHFADRSRFPSLLTTTD